MQMMLSFFALLGCSDSDTTHKSFNDDPSVEIQSHPDGAELSEGELIQFYALISDLNHAPSEMSASWLVDGQEVVAAVRRLPN